MMCLMSCIVLLHFGETQLRDKEDSLFGVASSRRLRLSGKIAHIAIELPYTLMCWVLCIVTRNIYTRKEKTKARDEMKEYASVRSQRSYHR
jgi:hypothetical protein